MQIHRTVVGRHLKVHSFNPEPPESRKAPSPTAIILICHGLYSALIQEKIPLPSGTNVRFAAAHGHPNDNIDYKWFQDIIGCSVASAVDYDFKVTEATGEVWNYYLGKGEPNRAQGKSASEMMSYDKKDRLAHPQSYTANNVRNVAVLSSAYVENIMRYAESKGQTNSFDFATVSRSCTCLKDVLQSFEAIKTSYEYLLCAFCREFMD